MVNWSPQVPKIGSFWVRKKSSALEGATHALVVEIRHPPRGPQHWVRFISNLGRSHKVSVGFFEEHFVEYDLGLGNA